jgi:predicted dinucleotide-binding enzyme
MSDEIKSVAIIGGAGNVGEAAVAALLKTDLHITIVTRQESKSTFP